MFFHINCSNNCGLFTEITLGSVCWLHGYQKIYDNKVNFTDSFVSFEIYNWRLGVKISKNTKNG